MDFLKNFVSKYFGGKGSTSVPGTSVPGTSAPPADDASPSFVSQFGAFADAAAEAKGFLDSYKQDKGPAFSGAISGGDAGGYSLQKIPQSDNSSFFQVTHPQAIVMNAPPKQRQPGFLDYAIPIAQTAATFASLCDIRLKTDISPLESSDTSDELAEIAFFVKGLRECA